MLPTVRKTAFDLCDRFAGRPKVIARHPTAEGSAAGPAAGKLGSMDKLRLLEAAGEAAALLGLATLPTAWHALDPSLAVVLAAMLAVLTAGTYALHAVTFDCFRLTGHRDRHEFSYTQRKE
jgi:hypothetical protein